MEAKYEEVESYEILEVNLWEQTGTRLSVTVLKDQDGKFLVSVEPGFDGEGCTFGPFADREDGKFEALLTPPGFMRVVYICRGCASGECDKDPEPESSELN